MVFGFFPSSAEINNAMKNKYYENNDQIEIIQCCRQVYRSFKNISYTHKTFCGYERENLSRFSCPQESPRGILLGYRFL
jgi:hypothetical protein